MPKFWENVFIPFALFSSILFSKGTSCCGEPLMGLEQVKFSGLLSTWSLIVSFHSGASVPTEDQNMGIEIPKSALCHHASKVMVSFNCQLDIILNYQRERDRDSSLRHYLNQVGFWVGLWGIFFIFQLECRQHYFRELGLGLNERGRQTEHFHVPFRAVPDCGVPGTGALELLPWLPRHDRLCLACKPERILFS